MNTILLIFIILFCILLVTFLTIYFIHKSKHYKSTNSSTSDKLPCWDGTIKGDRCFSKPQQKLSNTNLQNATMEHPDDRLTFGAKLKESKLSKIFRNILSSTPNVNNINNINFNPVISTLSFPIKILNTQVEEDSGALVKHAYAITINVDLLNVDKNEIETLTCILDTGSLDLVVQTDKSLEANNPANSDNPNDPQAKENYDEIKANGIWKTGYNCLIPNSNETIKYGQGQVFIEEYNTYLIQDNKASGLDVKAVITAGLTYNIAGMLQGSFDQPKRYGFLNYMLDSLNNCKRGFSIDLNTNSEKLTIGNIDTDNTVSIPMLNRDILNKIYVFLPNPMPFYYVQIHDINGVVPELPVYGLFDCGNTFVGVSNDYTKNLIFNAILNGKAKDKSIHNTVTFGFNNANNEIAKLSSIVPLSLEPGSDGPNSYYYIKLLNRDIDSKFNMINIGLTFQLGTKISYDLENQQYLIKKR